MQQGLTLRFYHCSWERAQAQVRAEAQCEQWLGDWVALDPTWLQASPAGEALSPLASLYYAAQQNSLTQRTAERYFACERDRVTHPPEPHGLALRLSTRLPGAGTNRSASRADAHISRLSIPFQQGSTTTPTCPALRLELFSQPLQFDGVFYGAGNNNMRWQWQAEPNTTTPPLFAAYERTMHFHGGENTRLAGRLALEVTQVAELRVQFATRPIPASAAARIDLAQPLAYRVSPGNGYVQIAAALEIVHLETGQRLSRSLHGGALQPAQLPASGDWPSDWREMRIDADGSIHHDQLSLPFVIYAEHPAALGLPLEGSYQLRVVLLAIGYHTAAHAISSDALGGFADNRLSRQTLFISQLPSLVSYTPGVTPGLIPAFTYEYQRCVLDENISVEIRCDLPWLTSFRFTIKLINRAHFAVGVIVQAGGWQCWLRLEALSSRYVGGAVGVFGLSAWSAAPLHPASRYYGWTRAWAGDYIQMFPELGCSIRFSLYITTPTQPDTLPPMLPERQAVQHWHADPNEIPVQSPPWWGAIKRYTANAEYDYSGNLAAYTPEVGALFGLDAVVTQPASTLLDASLYFYSGYATPTFDHISPWHKRPWPTYAPWQIPEVPLICRGERRVRNGHEETWQPVEQITLALTRALLQSIAAELGIRDAIIIDGRDLNWIYPGPDNELSNELWLSRFYTVGGALIDEAVMRQAFQATIDGHAGHWPDYRNLSVHEAVRFGLFMDGGALEPGQYFLGHEGYFTELTDESLDAVSTRFLYRIKPEFR